MVPMGSCYQCSWHGASVLQYVSQAEASALQQQQQYYQWYQQYNYAYPYSYYYPMVSALWRAGHLIVGKGELMEWRTGMLSQTLH